MRIGDIIGLPVLGPGKSFKKGQPFFDAKVICIYESGWIEFEFIAGPSDGGLIAMPRETLDEIHGREGGEDWKKEGK